MAYSLSRYTPYYYESTSTPVVQYTTLHHNYTGEYERMRDTLRSNQQAIERMISQVQEERNRVVTSANRQTSVLASRIVADNHRINALETDLSSWRTRFSNMHTRFDSLRHSLERKDYSMDRMREELDRCNSTVSEVVNKSKLAQDQYHKLSDELKWKKVRWESDIRDARDASLEMSSMRHLTRFRPLTTYRSQYDLYDPNVKVVTHYY